MLAMQTRDRVENIERMHDQLLASEKVFRDRINGKPEEPPAQAAAEGEKNQVRGAKLRTAASARTRVSELALPETERESEGESRGSV
jgi:hypothetical protein